jgi:hypothetical protein
VQQKQGHLTVGDFMTQASDLFVANIDTTVDEGVYCGPYHYVHLLMHFLHVKVTLCNKD